MRRDELLESIRNVAAALEASGMSNSDSIFGRSNQETNPAALMQSFATFSAHYNNFSEAEKQICRIFRFDAFSDAEFWAKMVSKEGRERRPIMPSQRMLGYFWQFLPPMLKLFKRQSSTKEYNIQVGEDEQILKTAPARSLNLLIREDDTPTLTASEFADILISLQEVYSSILIVQGEQPGELIVDSIDSGSDKLINIIGASKAIDKLSEFVFECWDRWRHHSEHKLSAQFKATSDGISLLEKIEKAKTKKTITREQAESVKRTVLSKMDTLLKMGVYTKEVAQAKPKSPAELAAQRKKLLTYKKNEDPDSQSNRQEREDDFGQEQKADNLDDLED